MNRHSTTASELKERLEAERIARALLVYRDGEGHQRILALPPEPQKVTVGRGPAADLRLAWDREVSRAHAELEQVGGAWTVSDDGLSTNGTFRNDERVRGRLRLKDGDQLRFGKTLVAFREPVITEGDTTVPPGGDARASRSRPRSTTCWSRCAARCATTRTRRRPRTRRSRPRSTSASTRSRSICARSTGGWGSRSLPQNEKRARLAELAIHRGLINAKELDG